MEFKLFISHATLSSSHFQTPLWSRTTTNSFDMDSKNAVGIFFFLLCSLLCGSMSDLCSSCAYSNKIHIHKGVRRRSTRKVELSIIWVVFGLISSAKYNHTNQFYNFDFIILRTQRNHVLNKINQINQVLILIGLWFVLRNFNFNPLFKYLQGH